MCYSIDPFRHSTQDSVLVTCCVRRHHSGPPKEGWAYVFPNTGETRLVNVQNAAGFTPLHYAVWVGRKQAIQVSMQCCNSRLYSMYSKAPAAPASATEAMGSYVGHRVVR